MNCYKCGRFIGPDGDPDVCEVDIGVYEAGYPTCGRCLKRDTSNDMLTVSGGKTTGERHGRD